jgi:predicted O-linked N-acetylglucosamine transferase (SPINDLY family)
VSVLLRTAIARHQAGSLKEARGLYEQVLRDSPRHHEALHWLGVLLCSTGEVETGVQHIRKAIHAFPRFPEAHYNLGVIFQRLGNTGEALANFDRTLAIAPDHFGALINRASTLRTLGRHNESLISLDAALAAQPRNALVLYNRGNVLLDLRRYDEAVSSYDRALAERADFSEAFNNRGDALRLLGRHDEALASIDRALAFKPHDVFALNSRAKILLKLKRYQEAIASADAALAVSSEFAGALVNRGYALLEIGRPEDALLSFGRALRSQSHAEALAGHGYALATLERLEEAVNSYSEALALEPDFVVALNNRAQAYLDLGRPDEAARDFERLVSLNPTYEDALGYALYAKLMACDWDSYSEALNRVESAVMSSERVAHPWVFLAISGSAEAQLKCAQSYAQSKYPAPLAPVQAAPFVSIQDDDNRRDRRIRIAYLSADFRRHATTFLMAGLFEVHDKSRFDITAISFGPARDDETSARLRSSFDRFIDVRDQSDQQVAELIRRLEIDIAVDLKGYTTDSRPGILALRPAPLQVNYLGYPGTLGASYIDYLIGDRIVIPEGRQSCYAEKVVYLPDAYQPNDFKRRISETTPSRAEMRLPETGFVFCSFNNSFKITPPVFDVWMRLLNQVEGSVLWLLESNAAAVRNLRRSAEQRGVAASRLVFAPRATQEDHLARHRLADLFLDCLPCNAHTTASDALWAGLPLVTCLGSSFAGRVAASLLHAVGLPELIAETLADYEALALKLATEEGALLAIKARLARNRETFPLFDTDRYRRHIESAYETMWRRHRGGEPPTSFAVKPINGKLMDI